MKKLKIKLKTGVEVEHTTKNGVTTVNVTKESPGPFKWYDKPLNKDIEKKKDVFIQDRIKELAGRESLEDRKLFKLIYMEFKGTKGDWKYKISDGRIIFEDPNMDLWFDVNNEGFYNGIEKKEVEANAKLIADAGNTIQQCDLLPSEILEQRNELLKALQNLVDLKDLKDREGKEGLYNTKQPLAWKQARAAIKKALK